MRIIEEKDLDLGGLRKLFGKILFYELQEVAWREAVLHGLRIAQRGVDPFFDAASSEGGKFVITIAVEEIGILY